MTLRNGRCCDFRDNCRRKGAGTPAVGILSERAKGAVIRARDANALEFHAVDKLKVDMRKRAASRRCRADGDDFHGTSWVWLRVVSRTSTWPARSSWCVCITKQNDRDFFGRRKNKDEKGRLRG